MAQFHGEARAIALRDDWLAPPTATGFLLSKFRPARTEQALFDAARLGTCADHFAWMKQPDAVADFLVFAFVDNAHAAAPKLAEHRVLADLLRSRHGGHFTLSHTTVTLA